MHYSVPLPYLAQYAHDDSSQNNLFSKKEA